MGLIAFVDTGINNFAIDISVLIHQLIVAL